MKISKSIFLMLLFCGAVFAQSAFIADSGGTTQDVYAYSAYKVYVDSFGVNPDFALRLCGVGQQYVAATYSANLGGGVYNYTAISWNLTTGSDKTLVHTTQNMGGGCYQTPVDTYGFSQFKDTARTPLVFVSAFPGRIHVMYSGSSNGASPTFVGVDTANGWLRGSYAVTRAFDHTLNLVNATVNSITFETDIGSLVRSPSDADWGLNASTGRSMLVALCTDTIGDTCSDAYIANDTSQFPVQLSLGAVPINDQNVYNRNVVVNGLAYPICVGSDISTAINVNPSGLYPGGTTNATITITNNGNVNITTDFLLDLNITGPGPYSNDTQWTITEDLVPGNSTVRSFNWTANGGAGTFAFTARADSTNLLSECSKANNNATQNANVQEYYMLHIWIDGNETNIFPYWGRPYNLTIWLTDSANNTVANPKYLLTETNGVNPFVPTQVWNGVGLKGYAVGEMIGDGSGMIQITVIPTCNKLYTMPLAPSIDTYVGNYSINVNASNSGSGSPYILYYNNSLTYNVPLLVDNYTCVDPGWVNNKEIPNKNQYVLDVYDWMYEMFAIMKKLVAP